MKAKDIFGLVVRIFGLAAIGRGFWYLYSTVFIWMHSEHLSDSAGHDFAGRDYLAAGVMCVVAGLFLLLKADWVAGITYPDSPTKKDSSEKDDHVA
jgi:hypothetical protein